jgi:predicted small metal-binding protein
MGRMSWSLTCSCGAAISAESEDELVAAAQRHVAEAHAVVAVAPTRADLLSMAIESDDG